jgi:hypothetical protein
MELVPKHHVLENYRGIRSKAPHIRDLEERVAVFTLGLKIHRNYQIGEWFGLGSALHSVTKRHILPQSRIKLRSFGA